MREHRTDWSLAFGALVPTLITLMPDHIPNGVYPNANGGWSIPVWTPEHRYDDLRAALTVATDAINEVDAEVDPELALRIHDVIASSHALELEFNVFVPNIIGTVSRMLRGQGRRRVTRAYVEAADSAREFVSAALWLSLDLALTDYPSRPAPLVTREALGYVAARARETSHALMASTRMIEVIAIDPIPPNGAPVLGFRSQISSRGIVETIETFFDIL